MNKDQGTLDFGRVKLELTGQQLRDQGIAKAVNHAEKENPNWKEKAFQFLCDYIKGHSEFMIEEVREASEGIVPIAPSSRAWGSIAVRAARSGLITRTGYRSVKNARAHCAIVSVWKTT